MLLRDLDVTREGITVPIFRNRPSVPSQLNSRIYVAVMMNEIS
jgi:hypothetical protein